MASPWPTAGSGRYAELVTRASDGAVTRLPYQHLHSIRRTGPGHGASAGVTWHAWKSCTSSAWRPASSGMHPQTLRKYERLGLVQPSRTIGSMRVYSRDEIERLRLIKHLVDELGINLAGVQRLLSVAEVLQRLRPLSRDDAMERDRRATAPRPRARAAREHPGSVARGLQGLLRHARRREDRASEKRSSRRSGSSRASSTPTSTRATRPPKRASRRSTKRTRCSSDPEKRRKYDELGANWRAYEQGGAPGTRPVRRLDREHRRRRAAATAP